ncbi:MAG: GntR family transcriptional regulator [Verrucomicrobia subdivision 3 bacterium]|nr:GntR family transcriptional regulator [Limisphaerales bacterium]
MLDVAANCTVCVNTVTVALNITINTGSSVPIYKQITEQVRLAVATGKLVVTDQLPSVRVLAESLVVNPNTVARAYADLAREGLIETRPGRGVFIIPKRKVMSREEGRRRLEPLLNTLISEGLAMNFSPDELQDAFEKKLSQWQNEKGGKQ